MTLGDHVGQPFFSNKNKAHSRWAGEAGCDSANVSSCWGVIAGDEAVLPHASWISFTSDHLESLFDCDLFAEPSRTLNFLFFHSDGKKLSGARIFFSLVAHALKAISAHLVF